MDVTQEQVAAPAAAPTQEAAPRAAWPLAIGLSAALGLFYWFMLPPDGRPVAGSLWPLEYVWGPAAGVAILLYLWMARGRVLPGTPEAAAGPGAREVVWATLVISAFVANAFTFAPPRLHVLALLSAGHLPALVWLVIGTVVLGRMNDPLERFAAVLKSIEALVTGALYAAAAGLFAAITFGLFAALQVRLPAQVFRILVAFLPGLVPVLAVASVYDPGLRPSAQRFGAGVTHIFFVAARLFLPLTLAVLLAVALAIPARFAALAASRETLAVFNAMLFAVMLLLVGATPLRAGDLAPRLESWLRRGIVAVALLTGLVSGCALAAILWRTSHGGLTPNRLTVIGWNVVNILALTLLLLRQIRAGREGWVRALHSAFGVGLVLYGLWTTFVLVGLPLVARWARWPLPPRAYPG